MSAEGGGSTKFSDNDYLEKHQVHEMFAQLLSRLAVVQPENPLGFLVNELQAPAPALVCVFGPPGAGKSRLCASLAQQLGVPYVSTSKLLQSIAAGPNAEAVHSYMTNGVLVPDAIVSDAVIARLREPDCARAGFVLDHFPATRAQAYALQRAGIVPTKYVYLDLAEPASRARLKSDAATAHLDEAQVSRALAAHAAHVNEMVDFYVDLMFYADATLPPAELDARVLEYVRAPTFGVQARVPHRVVLIGPVGAGKTLHAAKLAAFFGVEHISTSQLLRHAAAAHDTADAPAIRQAIAAGRLVPDEYVLPLLKARLAQYDVRRAGFVLDGCPRTVAQAQLLAQLGLRASRVAVLAATDDFIEHRLMGMRSDTVTRQLYCMRGDATMQPPANVHHRLVPTAVKPPSFRDAQAEYRRCIDAVKAEFRGQAREFDATASIEDVHAALVKFIKYPLSQQ